MEALLAALGVGGLDFFGGILSNSSSAAEASKNRRFARDMYKKRYQLTMQDMAKAGLNPVLAAGGGAVGSVPSPGSGPSMDNALGSAANSAMSAAQSVYNIKKLDADTSRTDATTESINQDIISKSIRNNYLEPQEEAMVKDAMARATNNTALAELSSARAQHAQFFADMEASIAASNKDIAVEKAGAGRYDTMRKAREYEIMPKGREGIFWDRLDRVSKAVGRGVNSALGLGKLKALSRAIR